MEIGFFGFKFIQMIEIKNNYLMTPKIIQDLNVKDEFR